MERVFAFVVVAAPCVSTYSHLHEDDDISWEVVLCVFDRFVLVAPARSHLRVRLPWFLKKISFFSPITRRRMIP